MHPTKQNKREKEPEKSMNDVLNDTSREPQRKRSKLVLPSPQISDMELEEIVKVGLASEHASSQAQDTGQISTGQLLGNYGMTPDLARLRTPIIPAHHDTLLTEAQDILALQIVDTPLKGGVNTPLHTSSFASAGLTPIHRQVG